MPAIPKTVLGTSDPIDICRGIALFPQVGTLRAGMSGGGSAGTALSIFNRNLVAFQVTLNASYSFFVGVCGPAYAVLFNASGSYGGSTLNLDVKDDQVAAGMLLGCNFTAALSVSLALPSLGWTGAGWNSRLELQWKSALNFSFDFTFDLIGLVLDFILGRLNKNNETKAVATKLEKAGTALPKLMGSWSFYDIASNTVGAGKGTMKASPALDIPINVVGLLKLEPTMGPYIAALEAACVQLSLGPSIGVVVPTTVAIESFSVDGATYGTLAWDDNGGVTGQLQSGTPPGAPTSLGVTLRHNPAASFDFKAGLFISLQIFKVFNVGASFSVPIEGFCPVKPVFGTYTTPLSNTVGRTTLGFDPLHDPLGGDEIEVVFEPLETSA